MSDIFYIPSDIPYRRRKKIPYTAYQRGGTGTASLILSNSSTGFKSASSSPSLSISFILSSTGTKKASGSSNSALNLTASSTGFKSAGSNSIATITFVASGTTPPVLPFHDIVSTKFYTALRKAPWRFIAQNARTREFLSFELPVLEPTIKTTLSGPTVINGKFKPETITLKDEFGTPLLKSWGTLIHFEMDGQIRASGIMMPSQFDGLEWTMEVQGFTTYPNEMPYWGQWPDTLKYNIDSIDVIQEIWRYLQSFPNGNLGVTVPRTMGSLPNRLGTELDATNNITPYSIDWWDNKSCGSEIDNMAKLAPLDYFESVEWNDDRTDVSYTLTIGYPRLGSTRSDLRFVQGENIIAVVPLVEPDSFYASGVAGIGAGEGAASIRDLVETDDPNRLRRIYTYRQKKMTDKTQLNAIIREELLSRTLDREMQQIVVSSTHPNAPFGSYIPGDDILPQAEVRWWGWTRLWHRVIGITFSPGKDAVTIDLKRSSSFRYGQEAPVDV